MTTDIKKASVKNKVEAVLFSTGDKMALNEISRLCRSKSEDVLASLQELKKEYDEKQSSLMLIEDGNLWKFTVRDHLIPVIRKIVTETELTKSVLETLAVIAFKYPILQSDLIKIRTNKAYDHLAELELAGYISRQKHGRTNLIKLTDKFFRYFDLNEENLRDKFRDFDSISKAIEQKEVEADRIKEEQQKRAQELKNQDEKIKKEIDSLDQSGEQFEIPLKTYDSDPSKKELENPADESKIGNLEVVEIKKEERANDANQPVTGDENAAVAAIKANMDENKEEKEVQEGIKITPEMQAKVDERVQEILEGEK